MKSRWTRNLGLFSSNYILKSVDGFYISYNYNPGGGAALFESDYDSDETALVSDDKFYILNGDFRKEYEELIDQGFFACKEFFDNQSDEIKSSWSN